MKVIFARLVQLALVSLLFAGMSNALAEEHTHHHEEAGVSLTLDQGKKWPVDDSLHTGMAGIKKLMSAAIGDIHHHKYSAEKYSTLAAELQGQLDFIFKHCKLPPAADGQLHILLSGMIQGVEQMKGQAQQRQGAIKVMQGLKLYPVYFNDVNW